MALGVIYIMTTVVPGLIKIGKTGSNNFEQRMYNLEHDGYRNVTGLKRKFAIEVEDYDEKETLLHTIFAKSRLADTELFAVDVNTVIQLLSSFDGKMIYPLSETKADVFDEAADNSKGKWLPNGTYTLERKKRADDNRTIKATAVIQNGSWTLIKGSVIGTKETPGVSQRGKKVHADLPLDSNGVLLEDYELGECSPSFAGSVVLNGAVDGWTNWTDKDGKLVDIYRKKETEE